jgi:hypothetical protein
MELLLLNSILIAVSFPSIITAVADFECSFMPPFFILLRWSTILLLDSFFSDKFRASPLAVPVPS